MIIPVILSGGYGTRLWPLSRSLYPKQFINLLDDKTLFQNTLGRLPKNFDKPLVICNEEHRFLVAEQLRQINQISNGIILEPVGKNTAPAIALAALEVIKRKEDQILLVLPADHLINDINEFHNILDKAKNIAANGKLVTFGVPPKRPETGYGYIEVEINTNEEFYEILSFKEKPSISNASKYIKKGNYLWNSGMFMFKASEYIKELQKFEPEMLLACKKSIDTNNKDLDFIRINNKEFLKCKSKSIDYAVMEHTKKGVALPLNGGWSDVGSWPSLWDAKNKDTNGNGIEGDVFLENVKDSYIHSSGRLISVMGLKDIIIVDTQDALLVANKESSKKVNNLVQKIKSINRVESELHRKVYRPWGFFDSIDIGEGFQVKRITVNPGAKLSLQKHKHRAEHWVVVKGVALITCGTEVFELKQNQSTYISKGQIHRLENRTESFLEIIEIQTGSYLGEDDIIRLEDHYERN
jgi:mannose-1-phosphate guanylyltransferase/mannose-6-phosphate isomerase